MDATILKQLDLAKSHSNVDNMQGACLFRNKKVIVVGWNRLPLKYHYSSEDVKQKVDYHISAIEDVIIKIGSYRRVTYADLEIAMTCEPTLHEISLILEMGFKRLWLPDSDKGIDPKQQFDTIIKGQGIIY